MAYKISGNVLYIGEPQTSVSKSGKSFTMRSIVISAIKFDQYTGQPCADPYNTPKFTFVQDRCKLLDNIKIGQSVTIHFDVSGRRFEKDGRVEYYNDIRGFAIDVISSPASSFQPQTQVQVSQPATPQNPAFGSFPKDSFDVVKNDDDLPF